MRSVLKAEPDARTHIGSEDSTLFIAKFQGRISSSIYARLLLPVSYNRVVVLEVIASNWHMLRYSQEGSPWARRQSALLRKNGQKKIIPLKRWKKHNKDKFNQRTYNTEMNEKIKLYSSRSIRVAAELDVGFIWIRERRFLGVNFLKIILSRLKNADIESFFDQL